MNIDFLNGFAAAFPIMAFSMFLLLRSQEKMFSDMLDMQNAEVEKLRRMRAAIRALVYNRDGCATVDSLAALVDEIAEIAGGEE